MSAEGRRVVVTGLGVVAPGGTTTKEFWSAITAGRTATRRITLFDPTAFRSQVAAECDFDPAAAGLTPRDVRRCDRYAQFALAAAAEAVGDAGLEFGDEAESERTGVVMGTAVGGTTALENEYVHLSDSGRSWLVDAEYAGPFLYQALVPSTLAAEVAARYDTHGPVQVVSTGCTSGIDAIGYAHQLIEDGEADLVIAGASDSPVSPVSAASFDAIRATTPDNDDPAHASRPFDRDRTGFVLGEGAAVLVMEERHARARGARVYCESLGYAARSNGFHMTGLRPDGVEMSLAIDDAMRQARLDPADVSYICAHGSGTRQNDRHETAAFKRSLGHAAYGVPISSIKSMVGHSLGAIGAIEMAACALAVATGVIPPTANWANRDPECDLDYTPVTARELPVRVALSVGSGFGGFQSAMLFGEPRTVRS